jgi:SAM-dependent methyltransferase
MDHLYLDGEHYDRIYAETLADIPFWVRMAKRFGGPVLEVACGTGRITVPLAAAGIQMTGLDYAEPMLRVAREKAREAGVSVHWVQADVRDFTLGWKFNLIYFPANSITHLLTDEDFSQAMTSIRAHMAHAGRFMLQFLIPDLAMLQEDSPQREEFGAYDLPDGSGRVTVEQTYRYDKITQIKHIELFSRFPERAEEIRGKLDMRMFFPRELDALLQLNGFEIESKWGDYQETPFGAGAERQLYVCKAAE